MMDGRRKQRKLINYTDRGRAHKTQTTTIKKRQLSVKTAQVKRQIIYDCSRSDRSSNKTTFDPATIVQALFI